MPISDIKKAFTKGLMSGYAGKSDFKELTRGGFLFNSSHWEENGLTYHDEWLLARIGGGQEVVQFKKNQFTRLYAGGVLDDDKLSRLGITREDVIAFLKGLILEEKENTRLFQSFSATKGDWSYTYEVIDQDAAVSVTFARESVFFKQKKVFVHYFLIASVS